MTAAGLVLSLTRVVRWRLLGMSAPPGQAPSVLIVRRSSSQDFLLILVMRPSTTPAVGQNAE
eukprot:4649784-Pyramimonas_sp.AAC.2